jgi:predicted Zn-dependent protease
VGLALAGVAVTAAGVYVLGGQYGAWSEARRVRDAVAARQFDEAEPALKRWLEASPHSGEAYYYLARSKLAADQPQEAITAIEQARELGFDSSPLDGLMAIIQARAGHYTEAAPVLQAAFFQGMEPQADIAQELARIYLATFQLERAAAPLARWKALAPQDARPYFWANEIESRRQEVDAAVMIQNYREALRRDPNLDKARLGLAERLRKEHRLDEARREYATYLARRPQDLEALDGAGTAALEADDVEAAVGFFEAALAVDARDITALKTLAQINLRRGRFQQACDQLRRVAEVDHFDPDIHYTYARALKLSGDNERAKAETELSLRLRKEHEHLEEIRSKLLRSPADVELRFQVARWYLDHGRDAEGLNWTKEILRQAPNHVPTHRLLADYHGRKGNAGLANYHRSMVEAGSTQEGLGKSRTEPSSPP